MEAFNSDGIFWLPENPESRLTGHLNFSPVDGAKLELIGTFDFAKSFSGPRSIDKLHQDIILGVIEKKEVTLYGCYESGSELNFPGFPKSSYIVDYIFLGCNFDKEEKISFESLSLTFTNLQDWVGITGFESKGETELNYKRPENIEIKLNGFDINIEYIFNRQRTHYEWHLRQDTFIKIIPDDSMPFKEFLQKLCQPLQNFLSLGIGKAIYPLAIIGKSENCKFTPEKGDSYPISVLIFFATRIPMLPIKSMDTDEMFFSRSDISDNLSKYINNWFEKANELRPVYDLYFGTLYNSGMYLEHSFLSLIQAIESYHRRMREGKYLSDDDYETVYQTLIEAIPKAPVDKDHYQSLKSRIYYGNEYSLRTRLKRIFEDYGDLLALLIDNKSNFINDVVNLRNYWTHYDKNLEEIVVKGQERSILVQKLKFIIEVCFLAELGLSSEKIKELIDRDQRYNRLKIQLTE